MILLNKLGAFRSFELNWGWAILIIALAAGLFFADKIASPYVRIPLMILCGAAFVLAAIFALLLLAIGASSRSENSGRSHSPS